MNVSFSNTSIFNIQTEYKGAGKFASWKADPNVLLVEATNRHGNEAIHWLLHRPG